MSSSTKFWLKYNILKMKKDWVSLLNWWIDLNGLRAVDRGCNFSSFSTDFAVLSQRGVIRQSDSYKIWKNANSKVKLMYNAMGQIWSNNVFELSNLFQPLKICLLFHFFAIHTFVDWWIDILSHLRSQRLVYGCGLLEDYKPFPELLKILNPERIWEVDKYQWIWHKL